MQLTSQEIATLQRGERLELDVPAVGGRCVVLRAEDFVRLLRTASDELPRELVSELVDAALAEDDAGDPWLAGYQSCRPYVADRLKVERSTTPR